MIPLYRQAILALHEILNSRSIRSNTVFDWVPLVVHKPKSRELYAVQKGVKKLIVSLDAYNKFNYTKYPVLSSPEELFNCYLDGTPIDVNSE